MTFRETPAAEFTAENPELAVIRPRDPALALETAKRIAAEHAAGRLSDEEADRQFNEMLRAQPYTFVGLVRGGSSEVLDPRTGLTIGHVEPGDSFIAPSDLRPAS